MTIICKSKKGRIVDRLSVMLTTLMFCLSFGFVHAADVNAYSQSHKMSLNVKNAPVQYVLDEIEKQSEFNFFYNNKQVNTERLVTLKKQNSNVFEVLDDLFAHTDVTYSVLDRSIILSTHRLSVPRDQQTGNRVSGVVTDELGEPLTGVNIVEKSTGKGTITDINGAFSLDVQPDAILKITYIGYIEREVKATPGTPLRITLQENVQLIDEVVVIGYGTQKKVNLTGAVSTVSSKALESRPISNANLALQGLAAGMNIWQKDGQANSAPSINIRGFTSLSNEGNTGALILVDNIPSDLSLVNPDDIESVTLLKDASASAIYGARAAYGVVLVTTKTAKNSKLQVDFNSNVAFRSFITLPERLDDTYEYLKHVMIFREDPTRYTPEQLEYAKRRMADPSLPAILDPSEALKPTNKAAGNWEYYGNNNWYDILYRNNVPTQTYNMRVAQKGERLSYAVSGEYFRQDGMMEYIHDYLDRYNLRGNATYKLTNWWDAGANFTFTRQTYDRPSIFNDPNMNAEPTWNFYRVTQLYPIKPMYNPDGSYSDDWLSSFLNGGDDVTKTNETTASFNTTFKVYKDILTVKGDATFRFTGLRHTRTDIANPPAPAGPGLGQPAGASKGSMSDDQRKYFVYNAYTNYNQTFGGKHEVGAMAGFNQEYYESDRFEVSVTDLLSTTLTSINLTKPTSNTNKSHSIDTWALRGAFGRLNYIFDNKYLLEVSGRYDGTSRFPKDSRFVFNPSGSLGWTLSNERFMQSLNEKLRISNLKLRASYGSLGNQVVGSYDYISTLSFNSKTTVLIDGAQPAKITQPGADNSSLTWETVRTVNLAVDLGLFENRLDLMFDKYTRYTEGMLTKSKTLPGIFGADPPRANAANLKTDGWELTIGWRDRVKDVLGSPLSYSARFMLSDYTGYITKYDNPTRVLTDRYEGEEMGQIWGYETLGYFSSDEEAAAWADESALGNGKGFYAGDLKFRDRNNDGVINNGSNTVDDPGDQKVIGNNTPHFLYSLDLSADWKGFDLRVFLHGIGKRDMYPPSGHEGYAFWGMYVTPYMSLSKKTLDNWDYKGDDGFFPRMKGDIAGAELGKPQTKYLQDASFMRLKNITLGYTLPAVLTNKWKIDRLRFYVSGENLLTLHHLQVTGNDPERFDQAFYPFTKVFSVGLNLTF